MKKVKILTDKIPGLSIGDEKTVDEATANTLVQNEHAEIIGHVDLKEEKGLRKTKELKTKLETK